MTRVITAPRRPDHTITAMREPESTERRQKPRDLESWWQEHSELDVMIDALLSTIDRGSAAAASDALEDLAAGLQAHLEVEEKVYFPLIERLAPEHAKSVGQARLAHLDLREHIGSLRDQLAAGQLDTARGIVAKLLEKLRTHEQMEARLIADLASRRPD